MQKLYFTSTNTHNTLHRIFSIGLLLSILAKHSSFSINPIWPFMSDADGGHMANGGLNGLALRIGAFAVLDVAFRRNPSPAVATPSSSDATRAPLPSPLSAYGSGALLFLIHLLFTDAGTIIAWAHTGFPLGPTAMPHGVLTILALAAGTYLATQIGRAHV